MKNEIWKDIKGYEGCYKISNLGRIKSLARFRGANGGTFLQKERIMSPILKTIGYMQATLSKNNTQKICLIHRLVGEHFLEKIDGKNQINHKDGDGTNNHVDNLEWCTTSENGLHSYRVLGNKAWTTGRFSSKHPTSKKVIQKTLGGSIVKVWDCGMDAVRTGFDSSGISRCCSGELDHYKGFIWEFANKQND